MYAWIILDLNHLIKTRLSQLNSGNTHSNTNQVQQNRIKLGTAQENPVKPGKTR